MLQKRAIHGYIWLGQKEKSYEQDWKKFREVTLTSIWKDEGRLKRGGMHPKKIELKKKKKRIARFKGTKD